MIFNMKSKKVYSVTSVRNEADIIESFVRYTLNFVDGMVINENCSIDKTLDILKKLKKEGLNIDILEDHRSNFAQATKTAELTEYTMKKYNPDWVLSLDADEFVFSSDYSNPREQILSLDPYKINKYRWVTYIVESFKKKETFIPKKYEFIRKYNKEEYKSLMSRELYNLGSTFSIGSHNIDIPRDESVKTNELQKLKLAHFPVRSIDQLTLKTIVGVLNILSFYPKDSGIYYHQIRIFDEIVKNGKINEKQLERSSLYYAVKDENMKIKTVPQPMGFDFCDDLEIKYTKEINWNILGTTLQIAESTIEDLREKKEFLEKEINKLEETKVELKKVQATLNRITSSRSWKLISKVRKWIRG